MHFFLLTLLLTASTDIRAISADALHARLVSKQAKPMLVDVRRPDEYAAGHIAGAILAPLDSVKEKLAAVPRDQEIVLICRSGRRSGLAYKELAAEGFTNLLNMHDGMLKWQEAGYPVEKQTE